MRIAICPRQALEQLAEAPFQRDETSDYTGTALGLVVSDTAALETFVNYPRRCPGDRVCSHFTDRNEDWVVGIDGLCAPGFW